LHAWLTIQLGRVSGRSTLAEAIRYALRHWQGLVLFLEDGRLELDTNTVERTMRGVALEAVVTIRWRGVLQPGRDRRPGAGTG
jgi:hypothetical protein